jgi:hypothetical protein
MKGTFEVRGLKVRTQTTRRYIVVATHAEIPGADAWARVIKRTDNVDTARIEARRWCGRGVNPIEYTIVDTVTRQAVS